MKKPMWLILLSIGTFTAWSAATVVGNNVDRFLTALHGH